MAKSCVLENDIGAVVEGISRKRQALLQLRFTAHIRVGWRPMLRPHTADLYGSGARRSAGCGRRLADAARRFQRARTARELQNESPAARANIADHSSGLQRISSAGQCETRRQAEHRHESCRLRVRPRGKNEKQDGHENAQDQTSNEQWRLRHSEFQRSFIRRSHSICFMSLFCNYSGSKPIWRPAVGSPVTWQISSSQPRSCARSKSQTLSVPLTGPVRHTQARRGSRSNVRLSVDSSG